MSMDEFLQKFKDNLDNQPLPDFDAADWQQMQEKLDTPRVAAPAQFAHLGWWAAGVLLLVFAGFSYFTFRELRDTQQQMDQITRQLDTTTQSAPGPDTRLPATSSATPRQEHIVEKEGVARQLPKQKPTTTVNSYYQLSEVHSPSAFLADKAAMVPNNRAATATGAPPVPTTSDATTPHNQQQPEVAQGATPSQPSTTQTTTQSDQSSALVPPLTKRSAMVVYESAAGALPTLVSPLPYSQQKTPMAQQLGQLLPRRIHVGVHAGLFDNKHPDQLTAVTDYGVGVGLEYIPGLQVWASGSMRKASLSAEITPDRPHHPGGHGVPDVRPPRQEFDVKTIRWEYDVRQWELGIQYAFNKRHRLQPSVGLGYGTAQSFNKVADVDFRHRQTGEEIRENQSLPNEKQSFWVGKAGIGYQFTPHWSSRLDGYYYLLAQHDDLGIANSKGLRASIYYSF